MSILAGFLQLHKLAETYVERGIAVSEEVNQISNRITVGVVTSAYLLTVGKWEEVRERLEEAKGLCEQIGDYRQWGDCTAVLGESAFIAGDLKYSMDIQKILLDDARRRRNPLHQCWGLLGVAVNNIRFGNEAEAIPMLEEALKILEAAPNLSSSIETNGQLGLAYLTTGEDGKALEFANRGLELATGISPTVYSMDVGYSAIADVYFELWEKSLRSPDGTADSVRLKSLAEKAIKLLRAFKNVFPIGQPSLLYFSGWYEWLNGKRPQAIKLWKAGLEAAQRFRMRYEEGLIHMKLGMAYADHAELRKDHFDQAIRIFGEMDAIPMLRHVRELSDHK
jgi:tetratricopeptide (TPR) repeat protein